MTARKSVKDVSVRLGQIVAVIASSDDLGRAARLRRLPDFFELRLDGLAAGEVRIEAAIEKLRAPVIVTARHPREGGLNNLSAAQRRDLLRRSLPHAAFVDVELRSAKQLAKVLHEAHARGIRRIISVHELRSTPSIARMHELADRAAALSADVFKLATRTDTREQLERLTAFLEAAKSRMTISVMGVGKLGRASRVAFARGGSALNYAYLQHGATEGQLSFAELRAALRSAARPSSLRA